LDYGESYGHGFHGKNGNKENRLEPISQLLEATPDCHARERGHPETR
jgi:hypothetical protein